MHAAGEARAAASFTALATSQVFVHALKRDVQILLHSFALTWTWLDAQTGADAAPPVPLRCEYGALLVFERVWTRNQWNTLGTMLGSEPETRRALYTAAVRAFLDVVAAADHDAAVLHAVGAALAIYLLWAGQHGQVGAVGIDIGMYAAHTASLRALLALPERARGVLDAGTVAGRPPPSADVAHVVRVLVGHAPPPTPALRAPALTLHVPTAPTRLEATTMLLPRGQRAARPQPHGTVGVRTDAHVVHAPHRASADEAHHAIAHTLGIPGAAPRDGRSVRTADAVAALAGTQDAYVRARDALRGLVGDVPALRAERATLESALARLTTHLGD